MFGSEWDGDDASRDAPVARRASRPTIPRGSLSVRSSWTLELGFLVSQSRTVVHIGRMHGSPDTADHSRESHINTVSNRIVPQTIILLLRV